MRKVSQYVEDLLDDYYITREGNIYRLGNTLLVGMCNDYPLWE